MLKLRRAKVVSAEPLEISLDGSDEIRKAWADETMVGPCETGDDVVVNVEALDLGLGSGGFDVVHVNLTRGLAGEGSASEHVMKLNYTSLQHPVGTIERETGTGPGDPVPVLAIGLHGHLAPAAWAAAENGAGEIGYIQTGGGALPGAFSRDVKTLLDRGLLVGHVTAGPAYGGKDEAITLIGAVDAASSLGWKGVIAGPGPGILGSATTHGHGGMVALDVIHAAQALGFPALLSPRLSAGDPRGRHQGLSHHSQTVIELALGEFELPMPEEFVDLADGRAGTVAMRVDLNGYGNSGLPRNTMGRDLADDRPFFAGPLAAGARLAELI